MQEKLDKLEKEKEKEEEKLREVMESLKTETQVMIMAVLFQLMCFQ